MTKTLPITKLRTNNGQIEGLPKNPRFIRDERFEKLKQSINDLPSMLELRELIVYPQNGHFVTIGGNMRLRAAKDLGLTELPCKVLPNDTPVETLAEIAIKDNVGFGQDDFDILANEWTDFPLTDWGMEILEFENVEPDGNADAESQIDKAAELNKKWKVKSGDLWQIGSHRLICGDSTSPQAVDRLLDGSKVRLAFTSPPYDNQREYEEGTFNWLALACGFSDRVFDVMAEDSDFIINLGLQHSDGAVDAYWQPWLDHCASVGHKLFGWYVWDKGSGFPGEWNGRLAPAHEWIFHFHNGGQSANKWVATSGESAKRGTSGKRFRQKDGSLKEVASPNTIGQSVKVPDSVIRVGREMARGIHTESHPAVFCPELPEFVIKTWSDSSDNVLEPFAGSGTTLVACQNLNRKCYAIEISENYCAVILERMSTAFPELEIKRVENAKAKGNK